MCQVQSLVAMQLLLKIGITPGSLAARAGERGLHVLFSPGVGGCLTMIAQILTTL